MVLCVVGHMPGEISHYTWFAIEGGENIRAQVVSTNTKRSPLTQGGLEIEIKVTVVWENKKSKTICRKSRFGAITSGEPYQGDTKKLCIKSSKRRTMYVYLYLRRKNQKIKLNFVLLYCVLEGIFFKTLKFEII